VVSADPVNLVASSHLVGVDVEEEGELVDNQIGEDVG
jgi:hypothetical protein